MPAIADQVATLEHDLEDALALIDQLKAANLAFDSANASLQRDNIALQLEVNDMKHYVDDARDMAERLAKNALDLLRTSRRHVGPAVETAPKIRTDHLTDSDVATIKRRGPATLVLDTAGFLGDTPIDKPLIPTPEERRAVTKQAISDIIEADPRFRESWPAQQAVAEIMTGDSGDEQPAPPTIDAKHMIELASKLPPNNFGEPMPIFLQRDTAFESANVRPIFG